MLSKLDIITYKYFRSLKSAVQKMAGNQKHLITIICTMVVLLFLYSVGLPTAPSKPKTGFQWGIWNINYPWPGDRECGGFVTRIAKPGTIPTRALASYPGSGNTWIRYLIEGASGVYTGSIFESGSITNAGHLGELRNFSDGSTILQKTHHRAIYPYGYRQYNLTWRIEHINEFYGRAVVVVRNPFNSILSYWNFYRTGSQTATADKNTLLTKEFQDFAFVGINRWYEIINDWLIYGKDVYFVFYEDLKDDPVKEIRALFDHLGIELDLNRLECIKKHLTGKFKRKNHVEENLYSFDHRALFKLVIDAASKRIVEKTGRSLPLHKYTFYE